jgi:hypothetical protein
MRKFRNLFFDDWVSNTLNYHPVSIWSIFNASKALFNQTDIPPQIGVK